MNDNHKIPGCELCVPFCWYFVKVCSHLMFAFASTSPLQFHIASMEMQTQTHRMGLNSFLTFYIDAMLNVDANANVKCEHTIKMCSHPALAAALTLREDIIYLQLYYSD